MIYENEGLSAEISNVGSFEIKKPISDAWMQIKFNEKYNPAVLSLLTFGIKDGVKNDLVLRLRYPPSRLKDEEAMLLVNSIKFSVLNLPLDTNIEKAFQEIQTFQNLNSSK